VRIEEAAESEDARTLVEAAFGAARAFHEIDAASTGIGDEQPVGPAEEVERWRALRERAPEELVERAPELERKLLATEPSAGRPRLVHGDYHLGNLLFEGSTVVAVIDWEICELGQSPLDEAALCLVAVRERFKEPNPGSEAALPLEQMVELAGVADLDWYLAATCHKYAAILGYNLGLHRRGRRIDPIYEELLVTIPGLLDVGLEILG
jgi:aminoglycoside phosphotransferase (APT) family kinase protein